MNDVNSASNPNLNNMHVVNAASNTLEKGSSESLQKKLISSCNKPSTSSANSVPIRETIRKIDSTTLPNSVSVIKNKNHLHQHHLEKIPKQSNIETKNNAKEVFFIDSSFVTSATTEKLKNETADLLAKNNLLNKYTKALLSKIKDVKEISFKASESENKKKIEKIISNFDKNLENLGSSTQKILDIVKDKKIDRETISKIITGLNTDLQDIQNQIENTLVPAIVEKFELLEKNQLLTLEIAQSIKKAYLNSDTNYIHISSKVFEKLIENKNLEAIKFLLAVGADPDVDGNIVYRASNEDKRIRIDSKTPLGHAVLNGAFDIGETLLDGNADPKVYFSSKDILHRAVKGKVTLSFLEKLFNKAPDFKQANQNGLEILWQYLHNEHCNEQVLNFLFEQFDQVDINGRIDDHPLVFAAARADYKKEEKFLEKKTASENYIKEKETFLTEIICNKGAKVDYIRKNKKTVFEYLVRKGYKHNKNFRIIAFLKEQIKKERNEK